MKVKDVIALFGFILASSMLAKAQLWAPVGNGLNRPVRALCSDSAAGKLYAVGNFWMSGDSNVSAIASWNGDHWQGLGGGSRGNLGGIQGNPIIDVATLDGNVFVGGMMNMMGGDTSCALLSRWDGVSWNPCGHPGSHVGFDVANGSLFTFGFFDQISGLPIQRFARWNGADWERFGDFLPFTSNDGEASAVEYFQGEYYIGGNFYMDSLKEVMRWNGAKWDDLEGGILGDAWIIDLQSYQDLLYIGGHFLRVNGNAADFMMAWDGSQWLDPFDRVQFTSQIRRMAVIEDELYILGGDFYVQADTGWTGPFNLARYDGVNFCPFGRTHIEVFEWNEVVDIEKFQGELYFSTRVSIAGVIVNHIAKWIGGDSTDICISQPVAVQDPASTISLASLYPNPTSTNFTLTLPPQITAQIQIRDPQGRVILPTRKYTAGQQIDVSTLATGLYFVEVTWRDHREVLKLIKQ